LTTTGRVCDLLRLVIPQIWLGDITATSI